MLHLVSQIETAILERIGTNNAVIFLENALFSLLKTSNHHALLLQLTEHNSLYVLKQQLAERGIQSEELVAGILPIDYAEFVDLTVKHHPIQSWT